jgi:5-methylthioadenosine/S-adenosylhomocysteine deaminase
VVMRNRKVTTIDEDALRREVADLMRHFVADYERVVESRKRALPYMLDAHRQVWSTDIGMDRYIGRVR